MNAYNLVKHSAEKTFMVEQKPQKLQKCSPQTCCHIRCLNAFYFLNKLIYSDHVTITIHRHYQPHAVQQISAF